PSNSTVTASTPTAPANNSPVTVTVILRDFNGLAVTGRTVSLTSNRGFSDTISPTSASVDSSGMAGFTVSSSTTGTAVFTANDTTDAMALNQTATITFVTSGGGSAPQLTGPDSGVQLSN